MRDHILAEIRRLTAANGGQAPGVQTFARETGIAGHHWRGKLWARWGDALVEAGFAPNQFTERTDAEAVLQGFAAVCRKYRRLPTWDEVRLYRQSDPSIPSERAMRERFGGRDELIAALAQRASTDEGFADLKATLPDGPQPAPRPTPRASTPDGFVYLIQSGDFYKIGRSDDLERRVKQIAVALPNKAVLVHSIRTDDPPGIEAYWHRRFADRRANGEWFRLTSLDVSAFRKRKFQ